MVVESEESTCREQSREKVSERLPREVQRERGQAAENGEVSERVRTRQSRVPGAYML